MRKQTFKCFYNHVKLIENIRSFLFEPFILPGFFKAVVGIQMVSEGLQYERGSSYRKLDIFLTPQDRLIYSWMMYFNLHTHFL